MVKNSNAWGVSGRRALDRLERRGAANKGGCTPGTVWKQAPLHASYILITGILLTFLSVDVSAVPRDDLEAALGVWNRTKINSEADLCGNNYYKKLMRDT